MEISHKDFAAIVVAISILCIGGTITLIKLFPGIRGDAFTATDASALEVRIAALEHATRPGILQVASTKIENLEKHHLQLEARFEEYIKQHDMQYPPQWLVNEVRKNTTNIDRLRDKN